MNLQPKTIAREFIDGQSWYDIEALGKGLINDTYKVVTPSKSFVLQRINNHVFPEPERIMSNLQTLALHIQNKHGDSVKLQIPSVIPTCNQKLFFQDYEHRYWRALTLIDPAETRQKLSNHDEAKQIGFALAHFHRLCGDIPLTKLHDTLPGFHITPIYYQQYQNLLKTTALPSVQSSSSKYCHRFIESFQDNFALLENARKQEKLIDRVIHGDPKLNNFLFKPGSDFIISLIDLDTVKPGLVLYDIGDCLRSCCHIPDTNKFDVECCRIILTSYLQEAGCFFTNQDHDHLFSAILLIPFELGLRFFNDYLAGNLYFKVRDPEQNLRRAVSQFQLCKDIAMQQSKIEKIISHL